MAVNNLIVKQKLAITLDSASASNVIPLFTYTPYSKSGYRLLDEYLEIDNLKAISWIYNIPAVEFPIFDVEDSESKQILTSINLEWTSPRIQLDILFKVDGSSTWQKIESKSLLNQSPLPYREFSLGSHVLGNNSMIGFQIIDAGEGLLKSTSVGQDKVTLIADLTRQVFVQELIDTSNKIVNNITTTASTIINSNPNRKALSIFNSSALIIYLDTVSTVSTTSYLSKLNPGAYYEAPMPIYTGAYYARTASGSTAIDIREYL